jgi:hypothetical protein
MSLLHNLHLLRVSMSKSKSQGYNTSVGVHYKTHRPKVEKDLQSHITVARNAPHTSYTATNVSLI